MVNFTQVAIITIDKRILKQYDFCKNKVIGPYKCCYSSLDFVSDRSRLRVLQLGSM